MNSIIVEGIDRLGKSTLIEGLRDELGYFQVVHYEKPKLLKYHLEASAIAAGGTVTDPWVKQLAYKIYQYTSFKTMFNMLGSPGSFIMDRAHLGEVVYAPMYRGYDGDYVFDLENDHLADTERTLLVHLTTSDLSFIADDGLSLDFAKREQEREIFRRAFERSQIKRKITVDVSNGPQFKRKKDILNEVLEAFLRRE